MSLRRFWFTLISTLAVATLAMADSKPLDHPREAAVTAKEAQQGFRDRSLIAKPRATATAAQLQEAERLAGSSLLRAFPRLGQTRVIASPEGKDVQDTIAQLQASGLYEFVEPDYLRYRHAAPNDPRFGEQWHLRNTGQSGGKSAADISATAGWDVRTSSGDVIVAVIDTGIRTTHEDLAANLWINPKEVAGNGVDDDANGYIDDVHGINSLVAQGTASSGKPDDDAGHGTSVASVIGAVGNNGKGIAGVAWQARIMSLKFDDEKGVLGSSGYVSNEIECIDYAIANGAKIINISYGSTWYSQAEYDAIKRARDKGVIVVCSAGNDGANNRVNANYPASYTLENVIAVANSDRHDGLASSSTYGGLTELAAPGTAILVCSRTGDAAYETVDGTSFSSPLVAGSLALMKAQFPNDTYRALINRLLRSTDSLPALAGNVQTGGRLNLQKALTSTLTRPFNDDYASRSGLSGEATATRAVSTDATIEASEVNHGAPGGKSLWWTWTAPRTGSVVVDTQGSAFDTTLAVYTGAALNALASVASNDDAAGRTTSRASFAATQGTVYQIAVDGKNGASGLVSLALAYVPANDDRANAIALTGVSAQTEGNNLNASRETGETALVADGATGVGNTVWFRWTAPRASGFTVNATTDSFISLVAVYKGSNVTALTPVSAGVTVTSFDAVNGETYHFAVDSYTAAGGAFTLSLLEAYGATEYGGRVSSSPAAHGTGTLAFANSSGYVLRFDESDGWSKKIPGDIGVATPSFGPDGTLYATTSTGLYALRADSTFKWERDYTDGASGSPSIGSDGTVYAHTDDGWLRALNPDGSEKWRTSIPGISYASPSIGPDGTVYLGSTDHRVYAVSPVGGAVKWTFDAGAEIYASIAIDGEGVLYVGTLGSKFYALHSNGTQKWVYTAGGAISSSAAIGADGTLYFGSYDKNLYAVSATGTLRWKYTTGDEIRASSPAVASDGTIYIGSYDGKVHAVTSSGTLVQTYPTGAAVRSSPLVWRGNLIFGSDDGLFYFALPKVNPANSPWPMHRQNAARTGRRAPNTAPVMHVQPSARTVAVGGSTSLSIHAEGQDTLTFQWYLNGAAIAGATQSTYTINNASAAHAGTYTVVVTNGLGSVTSTAVEVKVATASDVGRLINLSARAVAGADSKTLIVGLGISAGNGSKDVLIRGVGPTLVDRFSLTRALADPALTLFRGQTVLATNDNWGGLAETAALNAQVGAFPFTNNTTKDAALFTSLTTGTYTAHINAPGGTTGVALAEFYDANPVHTAGSPRLINISARSEVGRGEDVLIVGFVIGGATPCKVLIRCIGPTLVPKFKLTDAIADPQIELRHNKTNTLVAQNDNWGSSANAAELQTAMSSVGAFPIASDSKDAALLVSLNPGAYTAVVSGVNNTTGVALAEVYEVQ